MTAELTTDQSAAVALLLRSGKTIKEIAKFADLDSGGVTNVARELDLEPVTDTQRRAKALYGDPKGLIFQEIATTLSAEGHVSDDGSPMHHLTIASWVKNFGWAWGGSADGDYSPGRKASAGPRSKYLLRLSKQLDAEVNTAAKLEHAAEVAWSTLAADETGIVALAIIRGAASAGVTDLAKVKAALLDRHGDELRNATL